MVYGHRRALLSTALTNVADVTVEVVADDSSIVPDALTELNYSIVNGTLDVSHLLSQCCIQYVTSFSCSDHWSKLLPVTSAAGIVLSSVCRVYVIDLCGYML